MKSLVLCTSVATLLCIPLLGFATEEYAKRTGQACATCHVDPAGGGELTVAGKVFATTIPSRTESRKAGVLVKGIRLTIGYIHFLTAILWFGTILYVHLVLKPAYASTGLPRGELRVGIFSMAVMGVTGTILTYYRITSLDTLLHTRFGILLLIKISLYLIMVVSALIVITVIGPRLRAKKKEASLAAATGNLTPDDLASYDGKEGRPAYVAVAGEIYDATESPLWDQGVHMERHKAGTDLTEALKLAPHDEEKLIILTPVGKLIASRPRKAPLHETVFFFIAYMNLTIVFAIVLILALWRWG